MNFNNPTAYPDLIEYQVNHNLHHQLSRHILSDIVVIVDAGVSHEISGRIMDQSEFKLCKDPTYASMKWQITNHLRIKRLHE